MDDDPVPRSFKGHKYVRNYITSTLLKVVKTTKAQKQYVPESISDDDPKTTKFIEAKSLTASSFEKDKPNFSNDNGLFVRLVANRYETYNPIRFSHPKSCLYPFAIHNHAHSVSADAKKGR